MHLFLSPHFDDAVLSCGSTIHHLVKSGARVTVRTVMGGKPSKLPDSPFVRELHERWKQGDDPVEARWKEDETAISSLGATPKRMVVWTDCIYRTSRSGEALYTSETAIFGGIHPDDATSKWLPTVVLPPEDAVHFLYAPLGVGHHVDHQIVRNWALTLAKGNPWLALKFYEEYPYTEDQQAVIRALPYFDGLEPPLKLKREVMPVTEADTTAKINAIRCYQSQLSTWWKTDEAMETALWQATKTTGGEAFWSIVRE